MKFLTTKEGHRISVDRPRDGQINIHIDTNDEMVGQEHLIKFGVFINDRLMSYLVNNE